MMVQVNHWGTRWYVDHCIESKPLGHQGGMLSTVYQLTTRAHSGMLTTMVKVIMGVRGGMLTNMVKVIHWGTQWYVDHCGDS